MFSPDRFGIRKASFCTISENSLPMIPQRSIFRSNYKMTRAAKRNPLQQAAHMRFSEPTTPSVILERGWRPSDLSDPHKKDFLTNLTTRIFHVSMVGLAVMIKGIGSNHVYSFRLRTQRLHNGVRYDMHTFVLRT